MNTVLQHKSLNYVNSFNISFNINKFEKLIKLWSELFTYTYLQFTYYIEQNGKFKKSMYVNK